MWYKANSAWTRSIVAFVAISGIVFQFQGSLKAIEPLLALLEEQNYNDPQRLENLRTNPNQILQESKHLDHLNVEPNQASNADTSDLNSSEQNGNSQTIRQETEENGDDKPKPEHQKPLNVLILYPDDWRHDDIGGLAPVVRTPFLNELARDGIRFTHNMVTTSICWVSRATLFTGQYVSRHKSYRLRTPEFYKTWHNTSWPALLQQAGYYTGHVGKWQYYNFNETLFDYSRLFEGKHQYKVSGKVTSAARKTQEEVELFLDKRPKDRPFALTAAFYPPKAIGNSFEPGGQWFPQESTRAEFYDNVTIPHPYNETDSYSRLPYFFHKYERTARSRWKERFEGEERYQAAMKNYYSLITEVDTACRGIVEALERQGILNETLVIFTTDNGLFHSDHGLAGKWYPYQESIRVPLIIRDPRMPAEKQNTLDGSLTLNVDLNPTILGAAGITPPETVQGRNIADLYLKQSTNWRKDFLYEFPIDNGLNMPMSSAVVRKDLKFIYWPQFQYEQLFNLTEDPLELNDLRKDPTYADVMDELRDRHWKLIDDVK